MQDHLDHLDQPDDQVASLPIEEHLVSQNMEQQPDHLAPDHLALAAFGLASFRWCPQNDKIAFQGDWQQFLQSRPLYRNDFRGLMELLHPEDYGVVYLAFSDLAHGRVRSIEREARLDSMESDLDQWILIRAQSQRDETGNVEQVHGAILDITSYKTTEKQAAEMMQRDIMTGLPNRQQLLSQIEACQTPEAPATLARRLDLIILDLDRFRLINESLGEAAGDEVIRIIGERLRRQLRRGDMIGRLGGDQFAFVMLSSNKIGGKAEGKAEGKADNLTRRLEKLRAIVSNPIHLPDDLGKGEPVILDINIGLRRSLTTEAISAENLVRDATLALREAKNTKSTHLAEFHEEMHEKLLVSVQYEKLIRQALQEDWIDVHYQPVIESKSGKPIGFEALARITHPEQGIIAPGIFIPVAEETGLISDITRVIIRKSLAQLSIWQDQFKDMDEMTMAINLSPVQFEDQQILHDLETGLEESGLQGHHVKIEITESLLIKSMTETVKILDSIKQMGIQICIDDFGTGYSSLSYIRNYSFDTLKIDRSFIERITMEPRDAELVRSIVQMGQNVGMKIVVEGVEEIAQHSLLKELGCHFLQGYLVARPLPAKEASDWLSKNS